MNEHTLPIFEITKAEGETLLRYRLYRSVICREELSAEIFSVTVTETCGDTERSCLLCDAAQSEAEAENLIKMLAENTVSPLHAEELFAEFFLLSE